MGMPHASGNRSSARRGRTRRQVSPVTIRWVQPAATIRELLEADAGRNEAAAESTVSTQSNTTGTSTAAGTGGREAQ
jgi:hypothetical protein